MNGSVLPAGLKIAKPARDVDLARVVTWGALAAGILLAAAAMPAALGYIPGRALDLLAAGLLVGLGPFALLENARRREVEEIDDRFPDFLRDLAASRRAGLTLPAAVEVAARSDHGALGHHIRRLAERLDWNIEFAEAFERFSIETRTPAVRRAARLVAEASAAGGNVSEVLMIAARDARASRQMRVERRSMISMYVAIIHISFVVFLGVVALLYATLVPELVLATSQAASASAAGLSFRSVDLDDFETFYYAAALAQGLGGGLVAGVLGSGSWRGGLGHAWVMVALAFAVFAGVL
ncbi:MAG TPA: type II secretion system F family protein [Candidatus Thermoplasmatota archaeon]|nr:type II secretion system F family protein [Candidatus Thermoplasmatota archaeon]